MARLSGRDKAHTLGLAELLRARAPTSPWPQFVEELRRLLEADRAMLCSVRLSADGYVFEDDHWAGFSRSSRNRAQLFAGVVNGLLHALALYEPSRVDEGQRNRAFVLPRQREWGERRNVERLRQFGVDSLDSKKLLERLERLNADSPVKIEIADMSSCRALIYDGEEPLAWFTLYRREPFLERERLLLRAVLPVIRERLLGDRLAARGRVHGALAQALIESVAEPCFVVRADGAVELANLRGRSMVRTDPALLAQIRSAPRASQSKRFTTESIAGPGTPNLYLVRVNVRDDVDLRQASFARRWQLSPREAMAVAQVARGLSNKEIAAALGCEVRTVEFHLTRVFAKIGIGGRAALIALFWSG
jgi:DNA-binding CsgD family transcriptional regulator